MLTCSIATDDCPGSRKTCLRLFLGYDNLLPKRFGKALLIWSKPLWMWHAVVAVGMVSLVTELDRTPTVNESDGNNGGIRAPQ